MYIQIFLCSLSDLLSNNKWKNLNVYNSMYINLYINSKFRRFKDITLRSSGLTSFAEKKIIHLYKLAFIGNTKFYQQPDL